jgi:uncharacterized protein YebE (UPF0316 family)
MEMKLLVLFVVMNVVNVVIQTIKSIATIKCGKTAAALINALAYGLYTYIIVLTNCDLPMIAKCLIVASANFVGVWVVKFFEEKARKDKLWKVECTIPVNQVERLKNLFNQYATDIPYNYIDIEKYCIFNFYCATQAQSATVKTLLEQGNFNAKYFVSESKTL